MVISWSELARARQLSGLTQQELALRMGVSTRSIVNYEKPDSDIPRKAEHAIRRVLSAQLEQLRLEDAGDAPVVTSLVIPHVPALNPRLADVSTADMLRELLARVESEDSMRAVRENVGAGSNDVDIAEGLPRLSSREVADLRKADQALAAHTRPDVESEQEGSAQ